MISTEKYEAPPHGFRTFLILWVTQSISAFGSQLTFFALTIWLATDLYPRPEQKPDLAFALSAIALSFGLPQIFSAPIAGSWADHHDRKVTMMVADTLSGTVSLVLMALIFTDNLQLWMVMALAVCLALTSSFHYSAFDTSYAMIVPEAQLPRANGMMQTMWAFSAIVAPAVAAFLISLPGLARQGIVPIEFLKGLDSGIPIPVTLDAITFFIAAGTLPFLFIPSPIHSIAAGTAAPEKHSLWGDVKLGAQYILQRRPLLWLLATFTVANFASAPMEVFLPLLLKFNLAADWQANGFTFESALALLASSAGVGGLAGGLLISGWGGLRRRRVYGVVIPIMFAGLVEMAFGLSSIFFLTVALNFTMMMLIPIMNSHSQTIWQTQVPRSLQGRVFAVRRLIAQFSAPLAVFLSGIIGGLMDPGVLLAILGGLTAVFCLFQLFNKPLLDVENKELLDQMAAQAAGNGNPVDVAQGTPAEPQPAGATGETRE